MHIDESAELVELQPGAKLRSELAQQHTTRGGGTWLIAQLVRCCIRAQHSLQNTHEAVIQRDCQQCQHAVLHRAAACDIAGGAAQT